MSTISNNALTFTPEELESACNLHDAYKLLTTARRLISKTHWSARSPLNNGAGNHVDLEGLNRIIKSLELCAYDELPENYD